jgi:hypothetical protein
MITEKVMNNDFYIYTTLLDWNSKQNEGIYKMFQNQNLKTLHYYFRILEKKNNNNNNNTQLNYS